MEVALLSLDYGRWFNMILDVQVGNVLFTCIYIYSHFDEGL